MTRGISDVEGGSGRCFVKISALFFPEIVVFMSLCREKGAHKGIPVQRKELQQAPFSLSE